MPWRLIAGDLEVHSRPLGCMPTVETAVSALTEPARLARKIASPAVMARPTYG